MFYTVKFKRRFQLFWRRIRNVREDGVMETGTHRYFVTNDGVLHEVPTSFTRFVFGPERAKMIEDRVVEEQRKSIAARQASEDLAKSQAGAEGKTLG